MYNILTAQLTTFTMYAFTMHAFTMHTGLATYNTALQIVSSFHFCLEPPPPPPPPGPPGAGPPYSYAYALYITNTHSPPAAMTHLWARRTESLCEGNTNKQNTITTMLTLHTQDQLTPHQVPLMHTQAESPSWQWQQKQRIKERKNNSENKCF